MGVGRLDRARAARFPDRDRRAGRRRIGAARPRPALRVTPTRTPLRRSLAAVAAATSGASAAVGAYRLGLLAAALPAPRVPDPPAHPRTRFIVLIPAHDEAAGITATIQALDGQRHPAALRRTVVIADNCSDDTAAVARAAGAEVLERTDPDRRGKGRALAWAIPRVLGDADAVVLLDADCLPDDGLLSCFDARLQAGARVLQADYRVANPAASQQSALRYAGFVLENTVRSAGRSAVGLSSGLLGTGMAFTADVLARHPWDAFSFAEDREYHLRLVAAGEVVEFAPETRVLSDMPVTARAAHSQEQRWESGRMAQLRDHVPALVAAAVRRRAAAPLDAALEPLMPPQAVWAAVNAVAVITAGAAGSPRRLGLALAATAAQGAFIAGGLAVARTPAAAWRAVATGGPAFVARRVGRIAGAAAGGGPETWVRTEREAVA